MDDSAPRLLVLGAHPDDAEFHAGGLIHRYRQLGHCVKIVSVTNGAAGHHVLAPDELSKTRAAEAAAVGAMIGAEYEVWEFPDGELQPTLEVRRRIIGEIRSFAPDLVLTHRTNDYHPDHRAVSQAVQDASFTVTVPHIVPEVPALRKDPVVAYMSDFFTRPNPMTADVALDIGLEFDSIVRMLACHRSQVYEWLPHNLGVAEEVPADEDARIAWLGGWFEKRARAVADRFRDALIARFGEQGRSMEYAEVYEISEYAADLDDAERQRLFPGS